MGLVTFAGSAQVAQRATVDRPALVGAVDAIQMQLGTAIGNAIVVCLAELFPDHGLDLTEMTFGPRQTRSLQPEGRQGAAQADHTRETRVVRFGGHHPVERRSAHDGSRHAGGREDGG